MVTLESCTQDWKELCDEYVHLQEEHHEYCRQIDKVKSTQSKCLAGIVHQRYNIKIQLEAINRLLKSSKTTDEERENLRKLKKEIIDRKNSFRDLEDVLPHENGLYLKIVLGSVNVSLLSKKDKYKYKENYETFKLIVTTITLALSLLLWFVRYRFIDAAYQFLLVWYYCTLTIREHILKVNGSRIKGWWITHHFVSTVGAGIILIWPEGYTYHQFREQFIVFSFYISLVQVAQIFYQKNNLYRLRALGQRHNMDITVEGFQTSMWKGLSFILPFLLLGYIFQLYNAYVLFQLSQHEQCTEWQVVAEAYLFLILFLGNTWTLVKVMKHKFIGKNTSITDTARQLIRNKYNFSSYDKEHSQ